MARIETTNSINVRLTCNHKGFNGENETKPYALYRVTEVEGIPVITQAQKEAGYNGVVLNCKTFKFAGDTAKSLDSVFGAEIPSILDEAGNYLTIPEDKPVSTPSNFKITGTSNTKKFDLAAAFKAALSEESIPF